MRNMKTLLRLMGAAALTTVAASSVVACGTQTKAPVLNGKYATLLGWYSDEKTTTINQELKKDDSSAGKESYSIAVSAVDNTKITATKFNEKLLKAGDGADSDKSQAFSDDAAAFLKDLGFTPDSKKFYSADDVKKITALFAKVESTEAGKIEANSAKSDFNVAAGTCQINIMDKATGDDAKSVKKYTINTLKKDTLGVPAAVAAIVVKNNLALTPANKFKKDGNVLTSLPWADGKTKEKNLYDSLVKLIGGQKLVWSTTDGGTAINKYPNDTTTDVFLRVMFGEVKVVSFKVDKMPA
ncbi:hypothetical protein [Spiroplasma endosymbiont of Danaus chrysippus]|uniref:hypothetical protein n=1 Tax=Spiroplasma endosymbiont of Danaus chrysippus TaxID=2691041 RepID=UPI0013C8D0AF|nr:hypothetical protein [Spiroplasma endosymbiont of Danaus chrysippus]CAB1053666.1 hypothetical protein [Spiroplasma endosymbiont of Danaus chrysippus]